MKNKDNFDTNFPWTRHVVAAILTAAYAPRLIKKKEEKLEIKHVADLFWDFSDYLRNGRKVHEDKK